MTDRGIGSATQKAQFADMIAENPSMKNYIQQALIDMTLVEKLRENIGAGSMEALNVNKAIAFEPSLSCYAVKDITVKTATKEEYAKSKGQIALMLDMRNAESMSVVHLNPANLLKRTNYKDKVVKEESDDVEEE